MRADVFLSLALFVLSPLHVGEKLKIQRRMLNTKLCVWHGNHSTVHPSYGGGNNYQAITMCTIFKLRISSKPQHKI